MSSNCPLCNPDPSLLICETDAFICLWDKSPVSPGHVLVVPRRHIPTWFDADREEQTALMEGVDRARQEILRHHRPDGFNIGINVQVSAGQTIFHLHIHVIPRYKGDVPDPRGGVRNVIPDKGNFTRNTSPGRHFLGNVPHDGALIRGADDPLLPHLVAYLGRSVAVDFCVAFVQLSGLRLIQEHLHDLLCRGGKIRFLTGDYLGITDPQALLCLLDFVDGIDIRVFEAGKVSFHPKS
jgi:diadenosine tetraphosphate (Ap4A) HIT family hydrolase